MAKLWKATYMQIRSMERGFEAQTMMGRSMICGYDPVDQVIHLALEEKGEVFYEEKKHDIFFAEWNAFAKDTAKVVRVFTDTWKS